MTAATLLLFSSAHSNPFPPHPSREDVGKLRTHLAGLNYTTAQYGTFPAWFYGKLNASDRAAARHAHKAVGDRHIIIPISEAYRKEGTLWGADLRDGYDYTNDLGTLHDIVEETVRAGFLIDMPLAGDGMGSGPGYNDPVGRTYGFQWLMNNLPRIIKALQTPIDLTPYILFRPGWDSVFYGWGVPDEVPDLQPTRVKQFGELFRSLLPNGYLAIEHTPGNIPCGEGGADYAPGGLMTNYDTILSEFNTVHEDSFWQVAGRMVRPYNRPADQPNGDDPNPPFYLAPGTPRGPYFYVGFEPTIGGPTQWVRGECSVEDCDRVRAYMHAAGVEVTG